ncbi:hypothetical protein PAAG_04215 [Paracoccidioides lutzii Pb01]|uniref:Uncharacterized protein n=1 Tax=Paracoccidioides lutzii (strain ATCC MYA-826 / Pb01) TaxID=502779 RepID=C1H0C1_PARBA|nr:hypothetical protein PAAG_04215 [Paracoccidioides lutzii Pb01]EEH33162.2 hypothetical protein PAAG_04215 [Paracoccidioides lutzii Pb01]
MAPPTIYEAFWRPLDDLPSTTVANDYRSISASAHSTVAEDPPSACVTEHPSVLIDYARSRLLAHAPNSGCLAERMPQVEPGHLLYTEADVLLNVVANRLLNTGSLDCRGELASGGGCRTNVRWVYRNGSQTTNIAVLEVKNTKVLHLNDFHQALTNQQNARAKAGCCPGPGKPHPL